MEVLVTATARVEECCFGTHVSVSVLVASNRQQRASAWVGHGPVDMWLVGVEIVQVALVAPAQR